VLLELAKKGVSREQAYEWVQRHALRSQAESRDFKALLATDPEISRVLSAAELERAFDLEHQLRHVDRIFERVFQEVVA
jgi:adenylosuccinate lyase